MTHALRIRAFAVLAILFAGGAATAANKKVGQSCSQPKDCASKICRAGSPGEKKVCGAPPTTATAPTTTTAPKTTTMPTTTPTTTPKTTTKTATPKTGTKTTTTTTPPSTGTPTPTTTTPPKSYAAAVSTTPSTTTTNNKKKPTTGTGTPTTTTASQPKACTPPAGTRQADVTAKCKTESRSCNKGGLSCEEIKSREQSNQECHAARVYVQDCFTATDEGHQKAIDDAARAVAACKQKFINKKCT